jgi:hypothetical protein
MATNNVYLVDEQPGELAANRRMLELLLEDAGVSIEELRPLKRLPDYNRLLADRNSA